MNLGKPFLEDLFNKQIKFKIPVFQRHYVWSEQHQWLPLWEDFLNKLNERQNGNKLHPHYTGSIVLFQENTPTSTVSTYNVIDGQQRLTTFQLFITAFREICRKYLDNDSLTKELDKYLFNDESFGQTDYESQKYKLEPTKFNKELFNTIVGNNYETVEEQLVTPILEERGFGPKSFRKEAKRRHNMLGAFLFYYDKLDELLLKEEENLNNLISKCLLVLKRDFQFVEIGLDKTDDPQMIFETMNGRGASLTETDLIRNYIFMRVDQGTDDIDSIYEKYWDEFDDPKSEFQWHEKTSRGRYFETHLQFYIIDYLTLKLQSDIRYDQLFYHYKLFVINTAEFESIKEELQEINRYGKIYKTLVNPNKESVLGGFASRLKDMEITTIYPLLLAIEGDQDIQAREKERIYKALDSFITRRFLCGYSTKNYNNVFLEYVKFLGSHKTADDFISHLKSKTADTNLWPPDSVLIEKVLDRPLYREERKRSKSISNILLEVEHSIRGSKQEKIIFSNTGLTIEHILPQKWFEHWPLEGDYITEEDFEVSGYAYMMEEEKDGKYHKIEFRNKALHTIGNLTLLTSSLNPSVSNGSFNDKRKELTRQSTLILNSYFQELPNWDEDRIKTRTKELLQSIIKIWPY